MTESSEIDNIVRKGKEHLERLAEIVPSRALSPDEITKQLLNMYRTIVALQAECDMLKVWVDELKAHHHVTGDMIYGLAEQPPPKKPTAEPEEPTAEPEEPTAEPEEPTAEPEEPSAH